MSTNYRPKRDLRPALVFLNGDLLAVPIPLEREVVILGRALEADVRVNDIKVSRRHASITSEAGSPTEPQNYVIRDLGSGNGTYLNGEKITESVLQHGDKIAIGKHILKFELLDEIDREYHQQIRRLLAHDDLTGLLSSRSFFSELRRETARSSHKNLSFCVLMMDIDFFKTVNDNYGHLTGSKTIEEIGQCITKTLRTGDAASRFGGEEFAAFLLEAELPQALIAAERIRESVEEQEFSIIRHGKISGTHHVTMSIGISQFPQDSEDPIELVEMADSALYRAKRLGRNRVCAYRDLTEEEMSAPLPSRHR
ncbi:MAG: GGDEF domain-containing protein [Pyrinomonadaceae bacterium]